MPKLVLVPSPIGNLKDISLRALEVLENTEVIAAEDTRHSKKLLNHYKIDKPLIRLDAHTIAKRAASVFEKYNNIAYLSDAGTPGISDPGAELVRLALEHDFEVEVLPGATAFVPALVLSGLDTSSFSFYGCLARKGGARKARLEQIATSPVTSIIYESPKRVLKTLAELSKYCGPNRQASVSREISKRFETTVRGSLEEIALVLQKTEPKGEFVIVISAAIAQAVDFEAAAYELREQGLRAKELREALIKQGAARNLAYKLSLIE